MFPIWRAQQRDVRLATVVLPMRQDQLVERNQRRRVLDSGADWGNPAGPPRGASPLTRWLDSSILCAT